MKINLTGNIQSVTMLNHYLKTEPKMQLLHNYFKERIDVSKISIKEFEEWKSKRINNLKKLNNNKFKDVVPKLNIIPLIQDEYCLYPTGFLSINEEIKVLELYLQKYLLNIKISEAVIQLIHVNINYSLFNKPNIITYQFELTLHLNLNVSEIMYIKIFYIILLIKNFYKIYSRSTFIQFFNKCKEKRYIFTQKILVALVRDNQEAAHEYLKVLCQSAINHRKGLPTQISKLKQLEIMFTLEHSFKAIFFGFTFEINPINNKKISP